jgi:decaprenylphospho-beta-D-erythro-pentofuranosid-2-ulose 2-reductase
MKFVVIIGATSAMAQHAARLWASRGDRLLLLGRNPSVLQALAQDCRLRGAAQVDHMAHDLNDVPHWQQALDVALADAPAVDAVLLAYGVLPQADTVNHDWAALEASLHTNLVAPLGHLAWWANRLQAQGRGTLAAIGSVAGDRGRASNYAYGAAKSGLATYLQGLRQRLYRHGVTVLTIKPGWVDTPMTADIDKNALFAAPERVARDIVRAIDQGRTQLYTPWFWAGIMAVVRAIPERVFRRLSL